MVFAPVEWLLGSKLLLPWLDQSLGRRPRFGTPGSALCASHCSGVGTLDCPAAVPHDEVSYFLELGQSPYLGHKCSQLPGQQILGVFWTIRLLFVAFGCWNQILPGREELFGGIDSISSRLRTDITCEEVLLSGCFDGFVSFRTGLVQV